MDRYKILFLDIDGTILLPNDTIQESTKEAVRQVQQNGIEVFLATGRPLHEISHIGQELNINSCIGYNGAYATYNGNDVFVEPMDPGIIKFFLEVAKDKEHEIVMYTNSENVFTSLKTKVVDDFIKKFHLGKNVVFNQGYMDKILGVTLLNLAENDVATYEEKGSIHLSPVNLDGFRHHAFDVIRDNVNKGFAIQAILDLLGLKSENAIAFGDGMNDKEMLSLVGEGFAMGNAHPDLFGYAKNKTTDVTESGIFNGLKSLGLVK